jgi:hypothetical protein
VELWRGDDLVQVATSDPLVVAAGAHANLTVYASPEDAGAHRLVGQVTYDGYRTLPAESLLTVTGEGRDWSWWWLLLLLLAIAVGIGTWAWRSKRRRKAGR